MPVRGPGVHARILLREGAHRFGEGPDPLRQKPRVHTV